MDLRDFPQTRSLDLIDAFLPLPLLSPPVPLLQRSVHPLFLYLPACVDTLTYLYICYPPLTLLSVIVYICLLFSVLLGVFLRAYCAVCASVCSGSVSCRVVFLRLFSLH